MYENYSKIRDARGYSDGKVAEIAGVSRAVFTRWKNGISSPSNATRFKICKALGIPPTMQFTGKKDGEFVLDGVTLDDLINANPKMFGIKLPNGETVTIEQEQYNELHKAVEAYIVAWLATHKK